MGDDGMKPAKAPESAAKKTRREREAEVKRKYDFSVIRTLRQARGLTIEKFAKVCGLSYAPISRIETNLIKPNLDTLDKIAAGLGITTYNLVAMAEKRDAEMTTGRSYESDGFKFTTFTFESFDVSYGTASRGAVATDIDVRDRDFECVVVEEGLLEVAVGGTDFKVSAGESLQFDRIFAREYRAVEDTRLVVVAHTRR
ncbi:MAG: helix-turn-helix domain-containing protein [Planctomycetes bacterium]|nr:helix-turn-helix domain-containing protein [Planctomycetota bacterium]